MQNDFIKMEMDEIRKEVQETNKKVTSILHLLIGSEFNSEMGMIATVKSLEKENESLNKRVDKLEKWRDRFIWVCVGMGIPGTYGTLELVKKIFT
jgi:predicted nuclease with TOPRIM domain